MSADTTKIDYSKLDPGVVPLVKYFNQQGLKTSMSCEGHNKTNMSMFWIEFDESVTEEDIINFQKRHTHDYCGFCSDGWFVQSFFYDESDIEDDEEEGQVYRSYRYMAATKKAARNDLKRWKKDDK